MEKKAYFIGIAGKAMAPLAKAFKDQGWSVFGSDKKEVFPPISTYLIENNLPVIKGYGPKNIPTDSDLIVVGRGAMLYEEGKKEYEQAIKSGITTLSYPEVLKKYLIKENSIVVTGTYGKTTISALVAWILFVSGRDPSFMIGGMPLNFSDGVKIAKSSFSVVEGDETPDLEGSKIPKFLFYNPKYLIITATQFDHPEIYNNEIDYVSVFIELVKLLPKDGLLVYNLKKVDEPVVGTFLGKRISYSINNNKADYYVKEISETNGLTKLIISGKKSISITTSLFGKHNLENICASVALCLEIGIEEKAITEAVVSFKGVKTRLELLGKFGGRIIYWDFSQHPKKVKGALEALKNHYSEGKIYCVFDPAMTGLKHKESLNWYPGSFDEADKVIIGEVGYLKKLKGGERVSGGDIVRAISKTQKNVIYEPIEDKLVEILLKESVSGDVIVFMSSGGLKFTNLIERVKNKLSLN